GLGGGLGARLLGGLVGLAAAAGRARCGLGAGGRALRLLRGRRALRALRVLGGRRVLRGRGSARRRALGLLCGLGGGECLGLVWQERSLCAIRVPRSGPEEPMVSILDLRLALSP
ncbi:hypothetical protein E2651_24555, partial [Streptomyces sp. MZ04]